jgi:Second BRCT domain on Nijmegen syndrome breakage protein
MPDSLRYSSANVTNKITMGPHCIYKCRRSSNQTSPINRKTRTFRFPFQNKTNKRDKIHKRIYRPNNSRNTNEIKVPSLSCMLISTAKGLAALIHQKYIVTDLFGDALYSALTSIGDIFDGDSLPDPMEFLPATENYPVQCFRPNPERAEIFKGITFIFLEEGQFNNLVAPINAGHGKAIIFNPETQTVEELSTITKGQVILVQRNIEGGDPFCIEVSRK